MYIRLFNFGNRYRQTDVGKTAYHECTPLATKRDYHMASECFVDVFSFSNLLDIL